jgi:TRAP-type C4-dicarboxylate transport system substrate-binding protein
MKTSIANCVTVVALLGSASAFAQEEVLKVAHFWPPTAISHQKILLPWCDRIAKDSGNRLKCQIYPAMQLGGTPPQLIQQAIDGVADIVWTLPGYTAGRFPSVEAFELPFMTNRAESASRALWEYCEKYCGKDFASVKPLAFHVHDEGYVHAAKKQIRTLADFQGMKMRAPTRLTNKMLGAFGATPVGMPVPAVAEAISKGVIDGYVLPWEIIPTMKLHELTKYHSETDPSLPALYTAVFTISMNKARYDGLPADLRKVIDANTGAAFSQHIGKIWDESAVAARKIALDHGNVIYTIPASELAGWRAAGDKLAVDWVTELSAKGYPASDMLESAKDLIKKHAQAK